MLNIGTDITEIARIKKSTKREGFLKRYFGDDEIIMFQKKYGTTAFYQTIAANFAAKEAFGKSLSTGIDGFSLREVQVLRKESGAPYFLLSGAAQEIAEKNNIEFKVSLSHTSDYAVAFVVAVSKGD